MNRTAFAFASPLIALLLLASHASAGSFSFSTGSPDGLMATATRPGPGPGSGADQETESGDDFILATPTVINSATFIGLLPTGLSSSDIVQVRIEIYRVFPNDSDAGRTPNVPTRANSPSDVEFADRDSASGNLTVDDVTVLNSSFTAANSVDTGIHPFPNQTTLGDGPVTAQEIEIGVTFTTPFTLPADHYFFVPQVLLSNASAHFLWLSAPKPTSPPFTGDLQEWIRNADLDPDWLRVAMDIVGAPPAFNASFSLAGDADEDADGVPDSLDECPGTAEGAVVDANGCSIAQLAPCGGPASGGTWKNHGAYVSAVAHAAEAFLEQGLISEDEKNVIVSAAARSTCGRKE